MRLFIAILFDKEVENSLYKSVEALKKESKAGTFTRKENLHLTVNFIGETNRVEEVKQAMKSAIKKTEIKCFDLSVGGLGKFRRKEGDIYWIGVKREDQLWRLQKSLVKELKELGFYEIDDKEYTPHLTLGRRVQVKEIFQQNKFEVNIPSLTQKVEKISLMLSERIEGKLVYAEIYHIDLDK